MLQAEIIGNLGSEPELRYSAGGAPFLRFNVASNGRVRDKDGNWNDETTWVRVTVFGQRAESLNEYLKKGGRVYVHGRLEARPWIDQQDNVRAGLEVIASTVEFMNARQDDGSTSAPRGDGNGYARQEARQPAASGGQQRQQSARQPQRQQPQQQADYDDDNLPF